jgi:glycosyltransferase involved in cell wall biosynthesis
MDAAFQRDEPMMDLVVPIHGQLDLNKLFFNYLVRNTHHPFRLIVVDNFSQDRSAEFFEEQKKNGSNIVVIRNPVNQCYPVSINQGAMSGSSPIIGLLNNDIIVGPGWDKPLVEALMKKDIPVASPAGLEHFPDRELEDILFYRWRYLNRRVWDSDRKKNLEKKISLMYGDFNSISQRIQERYHEVSYPGIMGHCHLISRETFEEIGGLDPRIQSADWDLFLLIEKCKRNGQFKKSPMILGSSFVHHFIRATDSTAKRLPAVCKHPPHLKLEEKWSRQDIQELWPFKDQIPGSKRTLLEKAKKRMIKMRTWLYLWKRDLRSYI